MKTWSPALLSAVLLGLGTTLNAADAGPKDDVLAAVRKLADAPNYSWRSTSEPGGGGGGGGGGGRMRQGPTDGKADKEGLIQLTMSRGDSTTEAYLKGDKSAVKTPDGWKSADELSSGGGEGPGGRGNPGRMLAWTLQGYKAPAVEAQELAGKVRDWKKSGDEITGTLTPEGAKEFLVRTPRRGGGGGPSSSDERGTVRFWLKDGALVKYELQVQGSMEFNGNSRDINRTTTVEIKDVGSTRIAAPEDVQKKLS
ncbi:MAG: hypothetical protein KF791_08600 [Verrucomicrobiae bacterium]|nr:hypothetical protein [Verrucomicrobiae bacterium]